MKRKSGTRSKWRYIAFLSLPLFTVAQAKDVTKVLYRSLLLASALSIGSCGPTPEPTGDVADLRIAVEGEHFVRDGKRIWLNGANTPWKVWNDLGGNDLGEIFDPTWWDAHFAELAEAGINNTRVWLSCDGYSGVTIREDGYVVGPTEVFWENLDKLMEIARKHRIYIMGGLISFDHTKEGNAHWQAWRNMYGSRENMDSFARNYALPLVRRYAENPFLFSIDVCNEILWVSDTEKNDRGMLPWENLQYLVGKTAQVVHENSEVLVCVSNYAKYTSPRFEGNKWSDEALQAVVGDEDASVDFYKFHYYSWVYPSFGLHLEETPDALGLVGKPSITGEISAHGIYRQEFDEEWNATDHFHMSLLDAYKLSMENGWEGMQPWTSNGVDQNGDLSDIRPASRWFADTYPELVDPR